VLFGDGSFTGNDVTTDPAAVKFCVSAFEAAWERGIDHDEFQTTE
jgi:hypothetical protein